jgi:predicted phage tail protein
MDTALNNPAFRTIRLYGEMGRLFGRVHTVALDSNSVAGAMQFLLAMYPKMNAYLCNAKDRGVKFAIFAGKTNLEKEQLESPVGDNDIRIAPIIGGSKSGLFSVLIGAALVIAGTAGLFASLGLSAPLSASLVAAGWSMAIGGVIQLLTPTPHTSSGKNGNGGTSSYSFNGPINTQAQGYPVPLFYGGPLKIGSAVISAGISVADTAAAYQAPPTTAGSMGSGGDLMATKVLAS